MGIRSNRETCPSRALRSDARPYAASLHRQCEYEDGDTFGPHAERDTLTNAKSTLHVAGLCHADKGG